jgi:hypothetical protein
MIKFEVIIYWSQEDGILIEAGKVKGQKAGSWRNLESSSTLA